MHSDWLTYIPVALSSPPLHGEVASLTRGQPAARAIADSPSPTTPGCHTYGLSRWRDACPDAATRESFAIHLPSSAANDSPFVSHAHLSPATAHCTYGTAMATALPAGTPRGQAPLKPTSTRVP